MAGLDIYLIAVGGTGMAPLACLLRQLGHTVRGADGPLYPPMSTLLDQAGIVPHVGYHPDHLTPVPDLVVVGNAVTRDHPEVLRAEALAVPRLSMPEAVARFLLPGRRSLVVAGTHGKTTTSAMVALILSECGRDPGYLIGGVPLDLPGSFALGGSSGGGRFVVEGDEYNAAFFDRGPKVLHYRAETLILTSAEFDHADLYADTAAVLRAFGQLVSSLPPNGRLLACGDRPEVLALSTRAPCPVLRYGLGATCDYAPLLAPEVDQDGTRCRLRDPESGEVELRLRVFGRHNLPHALAAYAAARQDGLAPEPVVRALSRFRGVARRLEERGRPGGVIVVDDFAHLPTEVAASLEGLRARYPGARLLVLFEPRSNTAGRSLLFDAYRDAFTGAHLLVLAPIYHAQRLAPAERLDRERLASELRARGVAVVVCDSTRDVLEQALAAVEPGDCLVTMSSGGFDGLPARLLGALGPGP